MDTKERYKVDFRELVNGETTRTWELDDTFFSALEEQEIEHGRLTATLRVNKKASGFLLEICITGTVEVLCNRCLEPMTQPICASDTIQVQLGQAFDDDGERIIIPEYEPVLDVAWNLYETIALAIPVYHVHPEGNCQEDFSQYLLNGDEPTGNEDKGTSQPSATDTRWDALKSLLNNES